MREIKFRAWDKFHKKMLHEGDRELEHYALTFDGRIVESADTDLVIADGAMFFLKLMQFTGLHDKNGKEIYEGDVLELFPGSGGSVIKQVSWVDGHFSLKPETFHMFGEDESRHYEIIGNIHENPELLK